MERSSLVRVREICVAFPAIGGQPCGARHLYEWDELAELFEDAYRMTAPKRLIARLDDPSSGGEVRRSPKEIAVKFRTTVLLGGKTATGFEVPPEMVERLGTTKTPKVRVTIGGHTYRSTVTPRGGVFMLPLSAENRELAGVRAGDEVDVEVEPDSAPREVTVPQDFAEALEQVPEARKFFDGLSYSNQSWHVLSIEGAKQADTRKRRIEKAVAMLSEGRAR